MYGFSNEAIANILSGKVTKAYLKVLPTNTLPEFLIDSSNYLKDLQLEELRFVPDEGFIGQAVAKRVTGNFNNIYPGFSIQDREFELYLGVVLLNGTIEYKKYGTFIVQKPEDNTINDNTSFIALDYMVTFNEKWINRMTYPCTLKELFLDLVEQSGLKTKVTTFLNEDFIVENNQFPDNATRRDVLKAIAQIAFNWARIDEDNEIVMDFPYTPVHIENINNEQYFKLNKNDIYGPVNVVSLRNSKVEGENITIVDPERPIEEYGENSIIISDNPFAYTEEKRRELINAGSVLYGLTYMPIVNAQLIGFIHLNCLDKAVFQLLDNSYEESYIFNHIIKYNGVCLDEVESPALTKTEIKYKIEPDVFKELTNIEIIVDKANQRIKETINIVKENTNAIAQSELTIEGIKNTVSLETQSINEDLTTIKNSVETIQSNANFAIDIAKEIKENGVTKVTTETGYTFDSDGLKIEKKDSKTKSILDEKGLSVEDATSYNNENLLFAGYDEKLGETIVKSKNMNVEKYLNIGKNSRIEDYEAHRKPATGVFWKR